MLAPKARRRVEIKMKTINELIENEVEREITRGGFSGTYKVNAMQEIPHISGAIELPSLDRIIIGYNPEYEVSYPGKLQEMARDVARHEQNHRAYYGYNGCPRNANLHAENIVEPISEVLMEKGFSKNDVCYIANCLEDSILHSDLSKGFSLEGISEFFSDIGENTEKGFTPFYDAHVKLNMYLWGNKPQRESLSHYYMKDKKNQERISNAVQNFLKRTGISDLTQEIDTYEMVGRRGKTKNVKDREKIRDFLNDETNWPNIARIYAEEFSELMEPSYALPIFNHSGNCTKGRERQQPLETDGNEFDKEIESEAFKFKRAQKAYQNDTGVPSIMEPFETMDFIYQNLARKLKFNVRTFTESEQRPVFWYMKRDFDPEKDDTRHIAFDFDEDGKVVLKKKSHNVKMDTPHKKFPRGFPKTRFALLDTSGSMLEDVLGGKDVGRKSVIPWGDKSKYHYGVMAFYGLVEYLKQNHLLNQTNVSSGNFSNETIVTRGLNSAKKNILSPQFGGTVIDESELDNIFEGRNGLVFTISDGEVGNWSSIRDEFFDKAREHVYFHLQIGHDSNMSEDLSKEGFPVIEINNAQDLAQKVIDVTDRTYRN
jgi:hypothetical protein